MYFNLSKCKVDISETKEREREACDHCHHSHMRLVITSFSLGREVGTQSLHNFIFSSVRGCDMRTRGGEGKDRRKERDCSVLVDYR